MRTTIIVVGLLCLWATDVLAQSKHDLARAHYKAAAAYYQRGKYREAIREFEQSYELSRKPEILYNLAQCHDKLGEHPKVVEYLRRYLQEKPNAEDREQVQAWIANLERVVAAEKAAAERAAEEKAAAERAAAEKAAAEQREKEAKAAAERAAAEKAAAERRAEEARAAAMRAAAEKAAAQRAAAERAAAERAAAARAPASRRPGSGPFADMTEEQRSTVERSSARWMLLGDIGIGLGIAAMVGSAVPGMMAYARARSLEDKLTYDQYENANPAFDAEAQDDYRTGRRMNALFIGLLTSGTAILAGGIAALVHGKKLKRRLEPTIAVIPGSAGSLSWRF